METFSNVIQLHRVRCLECATTYAKPAVGGLFQENPGCPKCGYVGWIDTEIPFSPGPRRRFAADRRPRRIVQLH